MLNSELSCIERIQDFRVVVGGGVGVSAALLTFLMRNVLTFSGATSTAGTIKDFRVGVGGDAATAAFGCHHF